MISDGRGASRLGGVAGTPDRSTLDLNALTAIGVKLVGRLAGVTDDGKAQFAGSLRNMCALSDLRWAGY